MMNANNIDFEKIKNTVLPYFIKIYGEEYESIIKSRMDLIEPVFYETIDGEKSNMYFLQSCKKVELTLKFLEYNNIIIPDDLKNKCISLHSTYYLNEVPNATETLKKYFGKYEYDNHSFGRLDQICRNQTEKKYVIKNSCDILKKFGVFVEPENYNEWILSNDSKDFFKEKEKIESYISLLDKEYDKFNSRFGNLNELMTKANEFKIATEKKYLLKFLDSIKKYMTDHDKKILENYNSLDNWNSFTYKLDIFKVICNSFLDNGILDSFGEKANEILKEKDSSDYNRKIIINNRIKYYKLIGIYNDKIPAEQFIETEEAKSNMLKQSYIDDIISKKEHFKDLASDEVLEVTSTYKDNMNKINSLNLVCKSEYNIDAIKNEMICINPNISLKDNDPKVVAVLIFSKSNCIADYIDTYLIHEINHAVELSLLNYSDGNVLFKCGFEKFTDDDNCVRNYEAFSETINQLIAIDVSSAMHKDNVYLFDDPVTAKEVGATTYEKRRIIIQKFWNTFKKEIMEARISNNMNALFDVVGKENFEKLNDILNEYNDLPYYQMMDDIMNKRTTDLTVKREQLLNQSNKIYDSMMEHSYKLNGKSM